METSNSDSFSYSSSIDNGTTPRTLQFRALRFLQSPVSSLLEYSGLLRVHPDYHDFEAHPLIPESRTNSSTTVNIPNSSYLESSIGSNDSVAGSGNGGNNNGEVSIRIIEERDRVGADNRGVNDGNGVGFGAGASMVGADDDVNGNYSSSNGNSDGDGNNDSNEETSSQRHYIQRAARSIEHIFPFLLLFLVVFVHQHLQGFVVAIYITAILFKSNDILRKQTALKGERKTHVLIGYSAVFTLHIFVVYWWNRKDAIFYPLLMIPPKAVPPFWHAIFIILVNDIMVRQGAMVLKFFLLMYYKNARGYNIRRQGQLLTLVEYTLLLYRALLPAPVWSRFFLNKDYGSLFSALITGLYLTFKLTSIVEKVLSLFSASKALSRTEVHYGSHATQEQVIAAGNLCAICQEKMHTPIVLCCNHIFCEDCVSEWFERERTCPLCRTKVRPAELQSYGDGSTNLFFQLY